jgi:hypothetical protein
MEGFQWQWWLLLGVWDCYSRAFLLLPVQVLEGNVVNAASSESECLLGFCRVTLSQEKILGI